jgi:uncharacterized OB-fold protein
MEFAVDQIVRDAPESQRLWESLAAGRLELQRCAACERVRFPPIAACPYCSTPGGDWEEFAARGRLYSWVITHVPFAEELAAEVPYAIATVELECGPRIFARLTDYEPDELADELPVEGYFHEESGLPYVRFRPASTQERHG